MKLIAQGHQLAYDTLVRRHLEKTCAMAARLSGNPHDAEEIAQDAFLQLWISAPKWQSGRSKFTTWFYRIVMNKSIDQFRRHKKTKQNAEFIEEIVEDADSKSSEHMLISDQEKNTVHNAIGQLPEKQRTAILLCYQKEMTNKEAAEIMDMNIKALEALLVRGRKKLKDILSKEHFTDIGE